MVTAREDKKNTSLVSRHLFYGCDFMILCTGYFSPFSRVLNGSKFNSMLFQKKEENKKNAMGQLTIFFC